MIYIYLNTFCFSLSFNRVTTLDLCTKCVSPKYLPNKWLHFEKILLVLLTKFKMHTKNERSGGVSWQLNLLFNGKKLLTNVTLQILNFISVCQIIKFSPYGAMLILSGFTALNNTKSKEN